MPSDSLELSAIFDSLPNPVFIKNEKLHFVFINKAYEKMFNIRREQVQGKSVLELTYLPEEERLFYQQEDTEMLQRLKTKHHIFNYLYQGKKLHTCLYWTSGFMQSNGTRGLIGIIVDINRQTRMIQQLRKKLRGVYSEQKAAEEMHKIDPLTRLYTRGTFDASLQKLLLSTDAENVFSCIMLDIDHFKKINDAFGHIAGDATLKETAAAIKRCSRKRDMVCRYGGEEFVVLLPGTKLDNARKIAERMRLEVLKSVHAPDGHSITISAGCSEYLVGESGMPVVQRADEALYAAKESGRNRVCAV